MKCRRMTEQDLEMIERLEQTCFSDAWSIRLLQDGLSSCWDTFLVAEDQEQICGYAVLRVLVGEGEIQRIAVFPEFRKMGIGRKLMEAMLEIASEQGAADITLEVRAGNLPAINLYKAYDFQEEGLRRNYYHDPEEDALILWRRRS